MLSRVFCVVCRYRGHVNNEFRIDSVISSSDRHVLSGSEDGYVYIWHLVDVCYLVYLIFASVCVSELLKSYE